MTRKRNVLKRFLLCALFLILCCIGTDVCITSAKSMNGVVTPSSNIAYNNLTTMFDSIRTAQLKKDSIERKDSVKMELIKEVKKYIKYTAPKANDELPIILVNEALKSNIDLCFMMGQTQIETCFGTTGIGRPTSKKSIFGVMRRNYTDYSNCVQDYVKVLNKFYLTKGRTEQDLMKRYVTSSGARYAGSKSYETHLSSTYHRIKNNTKIYSLQNLYKNI